MTTESTRNSTTRALITGGAQGIGFAVAKQLAQESCQAIALVGRSKEKGAAAVAELEKIGAEAIFISADFSISSSIPMCAARSFSCRAW